MFEVKNCPKCGKLFSQGKDPFCPECTKREEKTLNTVRDYLRENPQSTMTQITRDTGISAKKINRYLREGKIETTDGISDMLKCMQCGASIRTGRFCRSCASEVSKSVQSADTVPSWDTSRKNREGERDRYRRRAYL